MKSSAKLGLPRLSWVALVSVCLLMFMAVTGKQAQAHVLPISSLESIITLNSDGSAVVLEKVELLVSTGSFDREIRTHFRGPFGTRRLLVHVVEVTDDTGKAVPFYIVHGKSTLTVRISRTGTRNLKLLYEVRNAIQSVGGQDEFLWVANDPAIPVESAVIHVTLPDNAAGQFRAQAYLRQESEATSRTALWSSSGIVPMQMEDTAIHAGAPGPLATGVAMLVDVFVAPGVFAPPGKWEQAKWFAQANPIVLLPVGTLIVMIILRRMRATKVNERSIAVVYEPPEGLTPAEAGMLVDDRLDARDVCATLVDLAIRGFIKFEETRPDEDMPTDEPDYIIRLVKAMPEWTGLAAHERTMLFHTFYGGHWTKLSSLRLRFPDIVPFMSMSVMRQLKQKHMYRSDPETAESWRMLGLFAAAGLMFFAEALGIVSLADFSMLTLVCIGISALLVYVLGRDLSAKTMRGMKAWAAIRGFQEFLRAVDSDRLRRASPELTVQNAEEKFLPPNLLDRYLPYAMALGIEHRWTRTFEGIAVKPGWVDFSTDEFMDGVALGHRLDMMFRRPLRDVPRGRAIGLLESPPVGKSVSA